MPLSTLQRVHIVSIAESWYHTPYRGWASIKGEGVDCGQLLRSVFIEAGHIPADIEVPKDYPLHIGAHRESSQYTDLVSRYFREIPESEVKPGDVVVWRLIGSLAHCHAGIVKEWPSCVIHAFGKEVTAVDAGRRRLFKKSERLFFTLREEYIKD